MLVVTISTSVSNVALHIVPRPVIFVPQGHQPLVQNHFHHELPTPVIINRLLPLLHGYDVHVAVTLSNGFSQGFPLYFNGVPLSFCSKNLLSALQHPNVVSGKLTQEVKAGRIAGPFDTPPFKNFCVSPLGVVPKKTPGEFRLIHHLSFPKGASVNDSISSEHSTVSYCRVDDAIALIKSLGRGCFLAKTDIKSAFRIIPIRPQDYPLLGMTWQGKYYYDRTMPMGCASSCRTFEMFSSALEWVAKKHLHIEHR